MSMNVQRLGRINNLGQVSAQDWSTIPSGLYSLQTREFPLAQADIDAWTQAEINPFAVTTAAAAAGQSTSLITSQTSPEWFICMAMGVVVMPDIKHFAVNGAGRAANANPAAQLAFDGFVPAAGLGNDATARPGQLQWGDDSLQAAWAFLNAYDFRLVLQGQYELFRELSAHVGACVSGEPCNGFGQNNLAAMPYIRNVNNRLATLGSTRRFQQQNVTAGAQANTPAQPPLVPVSYGGMEMSGIFGGWYPTCGVLFYPGMPIQAMFTRTQNDVAYHARLLQSLSNPGVLTPSADVTEAVAGGVGFGASEIFKGGTLKIGVVMRGYSLAPTAVLQAYKNMMNQFTPDVMNSMYAAASAQVLNCCSSCGVTNGLAGIDEFVERSYGRALPARPLGAFPGLAPRDSPPAGGFLNRRGEWPHKPLPPLGVSTSRSPGPHP